MKGFDKMIILFCLTFIIIVFFNFSKSRDKNGKQKKQEFWNKERQSQMVPRKDLSSLDYISIPYSTLPFRYYMPGTDQTVRITAPAVSEDIPSDIADDSAEFNVLSGEITDTLSSSASRYIAPLSEELAGVEQDLCALASARIINLNGISNTELRLTYGTANLEPLSIYDQNFTTLIRTLQKWGTLLTSAGKPDDAITVLSYSVSIGSDIAGTYALLARLYKERGEFGQIEELKVSAEKLNTLMKPSILRDLEKLTEPTDSSSAV